MEIKYLPLAPYRTTHYGASVMTLTEYIRIFEVPRGALCDRLGVSTMTLWRWEHGRRFPRPEHMKAIQKETRGLVGFDDFKLPERA